MIRVYGKRDCFFLLNQQITTPDVALIEAPEDFELTVRVYLSEVLCSDECARLYVGQVNDIDAARYSEGAQLKRVIGIADDDSHPRRAPKQAVSM